ncbi:ethanolamine ammonia-lyase reactivating factor EutA [Secundilactobacillus silagei]|uniref:Reactivating factor for ethanolamine ammonia lyase n=1 Tax=Secundilactobacillus silagei JCM 19001 TaxID=1302250 RepID=A0A1Z5II83_9LACO|nr:ethanolamine ammonia-lyase reactivating factor EutA [Secundilactobacillus silagei]TDG73120.1 hypothetical protein C5L25_000761 [Secundilactobacillus silagei JCM 19001]GAX01475.1 reactivating factor for ethanolamine ammonia lyase [Secundilactobacillus silagei JCM 19001]
MTETLQTVGIDIGTSTTSLIIAQLTIINTAAGFSLPQLAISHKHILYRSPVIFTPLLSETRIDAAKLKQFVAAQYHKAHVNKSSFKMGAIIMTGETARKANADRVIQALSKYAGDFVCATAGPGLESVIAGKSAAHSLLTQPDPQPVINLDIGGGTTNLAYFVNGDCQDTACFDIGGRLIRVTHGSNIITYIAPKLQQLITRLALPIHLGTVTSVKQLQPLIDAMVALLENTVGLGKPVAYFNQFITDKPLQPVPANVHLTFSGGVADCLVDQLPADPFRYGDIGLLLGHTLKHSLLFKERTVRPADETIQATVVGAGSQSMMLSGSTINYDLTALPLRNLPVVKVQQSLKDHSQAAVITAIQQQLALFDHSVVALALGPVTATFAGIQQWLAIILKSMTVVIQNWQPLIIVTQENVAQALGNSLRSQLPKNYPVVCLDQITASAGDYLDIGLPVASGQAVPVIVKTLIFS